MAGLAVRESVTVTGQRAVGGHQDLQNAKFLAGQRHQLTVPASSAGRSGVSSPRCRTGGTHGARRPNAPTRATSSGKKRLGQVSIRAEVQPVDPARDGLCISVYHRSSYIL
jgi:hypothetical protein